MNIKDYLIKENAYKQYLLKLKCGSLVWSCVSADTHEEPLSFFKSYGWDAEMYDLNDIECVMQELPKDFSDECSSCFDGRLDVQEALSGNKVCGDCKEKVSSLEPFKTHQSNVYRYGSLQDLQDIYKALGNPISDNFDTDWESGEIVFKGIKSFGVVYTWSHMDDFSDYPLDYCAIIEGAVSKT